MWKVEIMYATGNSYKAVTKFVKRSEALRIAAQYLASDAKKVRIINEMGSSEEITSRSGTKNRMS